MQSVSVREGGLGLLGKEGVDTRWVIFRGLEMIHMAVTGQRQTASQC
jgi:hypothetical protein